MLGLSIGLYGLLRGVGSAYTQGYWKSQIDSELNLQGVLATRWILETEESKLLYVEQRTPEKDPYRIAGFQSPLFSLGPVDLSGLLREAGSPLGYTLSGTVFREYTGIQLYGGKDVHKRVGFLVAGPDRGLSLGGYRDTEGKPHLFATFHFGSFNPMGRTSRRTLQSRVSSPSLEGFVSLTDQLEGSIDPEWFPSKKPVLSGPLLHWGSRARVGIEGPFSGSFTFSMIGSRPTHDVMGVLTHLYGELSSSWIEVKALSGYCTHNYVTPNGGRTAKEVQHRGGVTIFPLYPLFLSIEGEEMGYRDREVERSLRLGGGVQGSTYRFEVQREEEQQQAGWTLEGWARVGNFSSSLAASWKEGNKENQVSFSIRGAYSSRGWEGELWWKGIWNPGFMVEGGSILTIKGRSWKIGVRVELLKPLSFKEENLLRFSLDPFAYVGASLFFSAYDAHLPMKRISGSRKRP